MHDIPFMLVLVIAIALIFDYVNGMHDAANAIATAVSTRAISPRNAVLMAGALNFVGAFVSEGVAKTMGSGLVAPSMVKDQKIILAALIGALLWNLITWWLGLPSSSSHAMVGGLVGAGMYAAGSAGVVWEGVIHKVVVPGLVSPLLGFVGGFFVMVAFLWIFRRSAPSKLNQNFRVAQIFSCGYLALTHGMNDAQKAMGIITLSLITAGFGDPNDFHVPFWVKFCCASMIAMGTSAGGWRIIRTLGGKMVKLQPINGFAVEITSSMLLSSTALFGMPVSTTHVISSSIMGVGATKRLSAVRWGVAGNILIAWTCTLPAAALMGAVSLMTINGISHLFGP
jgi:PiT family inorganic phosphate transporter